MAHDVKTKPYFASFFVNEKTEIQRSRQTCAGQTDGHCDTKETKRIKNIYFSGNERLKNPKAYVTVP